MKSDPILRLNAALEGRYSIERELGEGGMATVYLAEDLRHQRKVAIKVLKPELAAIVGGERFLAEIRTTANLQHPHILPLHDSGEAGEFLFYVMPYVEGESLRDKLDREKQLGVKDALAIARKVADALDYAHERGVVHRDIKPANVLLSERGEPLIADFGIALAVAQAGGGRITETGLSVGTPHYMSPEQATGDRDVDPRSDVYAIGCVLYEMLAGQPPFVGPSAQAVLVQVLTTDAPTIRTVRTTVPPHVEAVLARALEKLPADRFAKAGEFGSALDDVHFQYAPRAIGPSSEVVDRPRRVPTPSRSVPIVYALAGALVLAFAATWGWLRSEPGPVSRYSIDLPEGQRLSGLQGSHLAIAPDGSSFVFSANAGGRDRLWLRPRDQLEATVLPGTEAARDPTFSPDGRRLSFSTAGSGMKVIAISGGPPVPLAESDDNTELLSTEGHTWGPDGYIYAVSRAGLVRFRAVGDAFESVTTLDAERGETSHSFPHALPDGRSVLFTIAYQSGGQNRMIDSQIAVVDLESGEYEVLFPGIRAFYTESGYILYVTSDGTLLGAPFDLGELQPSGQGSALVTGIAVNLSGWTDLALSASGTLMYTSGTASAITSLVWVDRDGNQTSLDADWGGPFGSVALSPDGTRVAVGGGGLGYTPGGRGPTGGIRVLRLEDGVVQRLTVDGFQNQRPTWTPDGQSLIYSSDREMDGDLWRIPADGGSDAELLLRRQRRVAEGFLTEDGAWLVYRTSAAVIGAGDIFALPMGNDTVPRALLDTSFGERAPSLSPSGQYLAYVSDETGQDEVFVKRFLDSGSVKWPVSSGGGVEPMWGPAGGELFYRSGAGEMVTVDVQTDGGFVVGQQRVLFDATAYAMDDNYRSYAVTRDGQRFVMIRTESTVEPDLIVVENFLEELKERMGGS